jgi:hypothetical protein
MLPHLASWLAGVLCALNVLFLIGLSFLHGVPPMLTTLFALALVSAVLTVGSVVGTILAWWGRFWSVGRRVHYTLVTLAALAFAWELVYWNLLGFRA